MRSRPRLTAALILATAALVTFPLSLRAADITDVREAFARTERETVLSWDSGVEPPIQNNTTGQVGMMLANRFQAPTWATHVVAVQYFIMDDHQDNPQDPGAPTTQPFMVRVWRPGNDVPGVPAANGYEPFSEMGEYPEAAWIEVDLPEPIDITDPEVFPDRVFYAGLEWLHRNNPYIGIDTVPPIDYVSYRWNWTQWELIVLGDVMIRAAVWAHAPETVHVDLAGGGDFLTIQEGLDAVAHLDTVYVAPGTYTGPLNRSLTFDGKDVILVSEGGPDVTIIDCEGLDRGFLLTEGETSAARIEGFTVRNGVGSGGAIRCVNAAPTIVDCVFEDTEGGDYGGAMYLTNPLGDAPLVESCIFSGNSSSGFGGAVRLDYSDAVFDRCTFVGNGAPSGGAIDCGTLSFPTITNSILAFGTDGGVVHCPPSSGPAITRCCVFGNAGGDSLCGAHHDNLFVDPLFCPDDLTLYDDSPCLPGNNPWGEPIGAGGAGGCGATTGAPEGAAFTLHPPRPNPTSGTTTIAFELPFATHVSLHVYGVSGRRVRAILDDVALPSGPHAAAWDGRDESGRQVAQGVYVCELAAGAGRARRSIVLLR
jgi:hypothetical protein